MSGVTPRSVVEGVSGSRRSFLAPLFVALVAVLAYACSVGFDLVRDDPLLLE